jgi:hypothetical protein
MTNPGYEIPAEWLDELDELRQRVAEFPEDDEDRLIREGEARFAAMTPEEQARITRIGDEILEQMQSPENRASIDQAFREFE